MSVGDGLQSQFDRLQRSALIAAGAGLAGCVALSLIPALRPSIFPAYLAAFLFWCGLSIGCLTLTILHHLVGGNWGMPVRRLMEVGAVNLIPMTVLFLPILIGLGYNYPWADPKMIEHSELIQHKAAIGFLDSHGYAFTMRAGLMFIFWITLALWCYRSSLKQDREGDGAVRGIERVSGLLMALMFLTGTFAAIDWGMTREPEWYSSMYGPMVLIGWGLIAFAFTVLAASRLSTHEPMSSAATTTRIHDLGNLMLAFTMLWAYTSFSQFLIIWVANLAEEAPWYLRRTQGGWQYVAVGLIVLHFFVPFFCLLFRNVKRTPRYLLRVAMALLVMHLLDLTWLTIPANAQWYTPASSSEIAGISYPLSLIDLGLVVVAFTGIGGVWLWVFAGQLRDRPVVIRPALVTGSGHHPTGDQ